MGTLNNVIGFAAALQALQARRSERSGVALTGYEDGGMAGFGAIYSEKVKQAQIALTFVGFPAGTADGLWGANTQQAARNFRAAAGLDPDPAPPSTGARTAPPPPETYYLDAAFDAALGRAVANAKGTQQAVRPGAALAPSAQPAPGQSAVAPPPGTTASLPPLEAAKQWLLNPGAPVYKKPVLWIGVGVVGLTLFLAMRSRE